MEILQTKTDIGLVRKHNEDYAVVTKHPKNKNIKWYRKSSRLTNKIYKKIK